jgi:hypothetical protein
MVSDLRTDGAIAHSSAKSPVRQLNNAVMSLLSRSKFKRKIKWPATYSAVELFAEEGLQRNRKGGRYLRAFQVPSRSSDATGDEKMNPYPWQKAKQRTRPSKINASAPRLSAAGGLGRAR